ncbi:putative toxin-antitoxin system toxin component, PIN family [soil metagenome]
MSEKPRLVLDTNVLVSAVLTPEGKPRRCLEYALERGIILLSERTRGELLEVLHRPRLQRYIVKPEREGVLGRIAIRSERVEVAEQIKACRDPKDDKFLEAAVSGRADFLVSGDEDLLVLHPFRDIPILSPAAFLAEVEP